MRMIGWMLAVALLAPGAAFAQVSDPAPVYVGGRAIAVEGGYDFGWPGVYFESRIEGQGVRVRFEAPAEYMRLLVDGQERVVFRRPGQVDLTLNNLTPGQHVVRLEKLTESQSGGGVFHGFYALDGGTALPLTPRARQIEFIGDSYTVGYGNTSPVRECTQEVIHDTTDTQQAFGPRVANHYGAEYRINAYSGFGVVRNYDGHSPDLSLPVIYPRLKPDTAAVPAQDDSAWTPQVIVINLGTNDFSTPLNPGERWADEAALRQAYQTRYVAFVHELAAAQPQARFVLMGSDAFYADVERIAAAVNAAAPGKVTTLKFGDLDHMACDGHPSLADDARLATLIQTHIDGLGVWGQPN
ncbi:MAG: lipase [Brevundimonas sp.]|nr:MAG: lipase [Brevundimonas sp.]